MTMERENETTILLWLFIKRFGVRMGADVDYGRVSYKRLDTGINSVSEFLIKITLKRVSSKHSEKSKNE